LPQDRLPGQALVTRRAVTDIVRAVTLGSYGVVDVGGSGIWRRLGVLSGGANGVRVSLADGRIAIDLRLRVASGVPIAEVARQVESAVRFAIRRALRREVDRLTIRVSGLAVRPASAPPQPSTTASVGLGSSELADSGSDVA
jgi:uncharacterized alkaline shock family protein YloU